MEKSTCRAIPRCLSVSPLACLCLFLNKKILLSAERNVPTLCSVSEIVRKVWGSFYCPDFST